MKTSTTGLNLIKSFEGCHLAAYKVAGANEKYYTIGYGHYGADVRAGMTITQAQADEYLKADLAKFEKKVEKYNDTYHWTQNEFDALVSFAFNIGNIDQLTAKGTRTKAEIAKKMLEYNKAGGKVFQGLVRRRAAEQKLFLSVSGVSGVSNVSDTKVTEKTEVKTEAETKGTNKVELKKLSTTTNRHHIQVAMIQGVLQSKGYDCGKIDGVFGPKTDVAVQNFQEDHKLKADGIVGPKTWTKLLM